MGSLRNVRNIHAYLEVKSVCLSARLISETNGRISTKFGSHVY